MPGPKKPSITERKKPKQARSNDLVATVLDAAVQVLEVEGARRFTVARVAERAGVSVGSIYQYFPNKASILFRLQSDEWRGTTALLRQILEDRSKAPPDRLRKLVHAFLLSECEEARVRTALDDAAPLYRDAPEAEAAKTEGTTVIRAFIAETLPNLDSEQSHRVTNLIEATLSQVGANFSETDRSAIEIDAYANAMADMFCAYVERLAAANPGRT